MLNALVLAMALTGQTTNNYNLIAQAPAQTEPIPRARLGPAPTEEEIAPGLAADLAETREQVRELRRELADIKAAARVQAQRNRVASTRPATERVVTARPAFSRIVSGGGIESEPVVYQQGGSSSCYSESYQSAPPPVVQAPPPMVMQGSSCYSSAYSSAPSTYSAPLVYSMPQVIRSAPQVIRSAPVMYAEAPVMYAEMPALSTGTTVTRERTRMGLFGNFRQNIRSVSTGGFASMPATFFGAGGGVCVSGSCR